MKQHKHVIKAWPKIGNHRTWGWQCGQCEKGGWVNNWATARAALDDHIHLRHMRRSLRGLYEKFTNRELL